MIPNDKSRINLTLSNDIISELETQRVLKGYSSRNELIYDILQSFVYGDDNFKTRILALETEVGRLRTQLSDTALKLDYMLTLMFAMNCITAPASQELYKTVSDAISEIIMKESGMSTYKFTRMGKDLAAQMSVKTNNQISAPKNFNTKIAEAKISSPSNSDDYSDALYDSSPKQTAEKETPYPGDDKKAQIAIVAKRLHDKKESGVRLTDLEQTQYEMICRNHPDIIDSL